jgi:hypothetical protein
MITLSLLHSALRLNAASWLVPGHRQEAFASLIRTDGPPLLFIVGVLLWFVPVSAAGLWMIRAQAEYIRLYRAKRDPALPAPERLAVSPLASFSLSSRYWKIVWEPQTDPELERLRGQVIRRWWLAIVLGVGGWVLTLFLGSLST